MCRRNDIGGGKHVLDEQVARLPRAAVLLHSGLPHRHARMRERVGDNLEPVTAGRDGYNIQAFGAITRRILTGQAQCLVVEIDIGQSRLIGLKLDAHHRLGGAELQLIVVGTVTVIIKVISATVSPGCPRGENDRATAAYEARLCGPSREPG